MSTKLPLHAFFVDVTVNKEQMGVAGNILGFSLFRVHVFNSNHEEPLIHVDFPFSGMSCGSKIRLFSSSKENLKRISGDFEKIAKAKLVSITRPEETPDSPTWVCVKRVNLKSKKSATFQYPPFVRVRSQSTDKTFPIYFQRQIVYTRAGKFSPNTYGLNAHLPSF